MIANVVGGVIVDIVNAESTNPNTTVFSDPGGVGARTGNITSANLTSSVNVTEFHEEQFTPENQTGFELPTAEEFFDTIDFLNVGESLEFLDTFNVFFVTQQMDNMLFLVGVEFPPGLLDGIGVILTFTAIIWFIFIIFRIAPSSFT